MHNFFIPGFIVDYIIEKGIHEGFDQIFILYPYIVIMSSNQKGYYIWLLNKFYNHFIYKQLTTF